MRMAVVGNGNTEMDLHALAVFLKICSPHSRNTFVLDSSDLNEDKMRSDGTLIIFCNICKNL